MSYNRLLETNSTPRSSIDHGSIEDEDVHDIASLRSKTSSKKLLSDADQIQMLTSRLDRLEGEVIRLKDQQIKSKIYIKDLEEKLKNLESALHGLTEPKQDLATPFALGSKQKRKNLLKKSISEDIPSDHNQINYDHVISSKNSGSRERLGLFGSLGAASQYR